jgi:hypothetical protein
MEATVGVIHPAFVKLIEICNSIGFGEIQALKIADGVPVFVEYIIETALNGVVVIKKKLV